VAQTTRKNEKRRPCWAAFGDGKTLTERNGKD
jgi:hypothetical protein